MTDPTQDVETEGVLDALCSLSPHEVNSLLAEEVLGWRWIARRGEDGLLHVLTPDALAVQAELRKRQILSTIVKSPPPNSLIAMESIPDFSGDLNLIQIAEDRIASDGKLPEYVSALFDAMRAEGADKPYLYSVIASAATRLGVLLTFDADIKERVRVRINEWRRVARSAAGQSTEG